MKDDHPLFKISRSLVSRLEEEVSPSRERLWFIYGYLNGDYGSSRYANEFFRGECYPLLEENLSAFLSGYKACVRSQVALCGGVTDCFGLLRDIPARYREALGSAFIEGFKDGIDRILSRKKLSMRDVDAFILAMSGQHYRKNMFKSPLPSSLDWPIPSAKDCERVKRALIDLPFEQEQRLYNLFRFIACFPHRDSTCEYQALMDEKDISLMIDHSERLSRLDLLMRKLGPRIEQSFPDQLQHAQEKTRALLQQMFFGRENYNYQNYATGCNHPLQGMVGDLFRSFEATYQARALEVSQHSLPTRVFVVFNQLSGFVVVDRCSEEWVQGLPHEVLCSENDLPEEFHYRASPDDTTEYVSGKIELQKITFGKLKKALPQIEHAIDEMVLSRPRFS